MHFMLTACSNFFGCSHLLCFRASSLPRPPAWLVNQCTTGNLAPCSPPFPALDGCPLKITLMQNFTPCVDVLRKMYNRWIHWVWTICVTEQNQKEFLPRWGNSNTWGYWSTFFWFFSTGLVPSKLKLSYWYHYDAGKTEDPRGIWKWDLLKH
jgi:hypothetical protein